MFGQYSANPRPLDESRPRTTAEPKKRLRHVVDNPAHIFAHPRQKDGSGFEQDNARVSGGRWYFKTSSDGTRVMYSYRDSYIIASRFELGRKTVFLLRAGKPYSVTTSGHMNATRAAVPRHDKGVEVFTVPAMVHGYDHSKPTQTEHDYNVAAYVADINDAIERHGKARSSSNIRGAMTEAVDLTAEVKQYAKVFKLKLPVLPKVPKLDADKLAQVIERERVRDEKATAKRAAERSAYEAQHQAEVDRWMNGPAACNHIGADGKPQHSYSYRHSCQSQREQEEWERTKVEKIAAWKRGEDVHLRLGYSEHAILRVRTFGADESAAGAVGRVETSHGVQVPISGPTGAARLFRFLKALKDAGRTYQQNGHSERIGQFTVTSFDGEILVAGCHFLTWQEIESIAPAVLAADQQEAL